MQNLIIGIVIGVFGTIVIEFIAAMVWAYFASQKL